MGRIQRACAHGVLLLGSIGSVAGGEDAVERVDEDVDEARVTTRGGLILRTFWKSPVGCMITPSSSRRSQIAAVSAVAGSRVSRSRTNSTPRYSPEPCTVPMRSCSRAELFEAPLEVAADDPRVLLQAFLFDHVEHGHADRRRDGRASGGGEEVPLRAVAVGDLAPRDHRTERVTAADGLRHRDDVGHGPCCWKPRTTRRGGRSRPAPRRRSRARRGGGIAAYTSVR